MPYRRREDGRIEQYSDTTPALYFTWDEYHEQQRLYMEYQQQMRRDLSWQQLGNATVPAGSILGGLQNSMLGGGLPAAIGNSISFAPMAAKRKPVPQEIDNEEEEMKLKLVNRFKVGADPEFVMLNADGSVFETGLMYEGEIGTDHGGRVVELRPAPSRQAYRVVRRINNLLHSDTLRAYSTPKWRAGGYARIRRDAEQRVQPLGGHVHIGLEYFKASSEDLAYWKVHQPDYYKKVMSSNSRQLDSALDTTIRNLEGLEILHSGEATSRRSNNSGYGRFGDCRTAGSDSHLEYRTPISWLYSPVTAYATLTSCKLAAAAPDSVHEVTSFDAYADWVKRFASSDMDAARLSEKFTSLSQLQADPDADMKTTWPRELAF